MLLKNEICSDLLAILIALTVLSVGCSTDANKTKTTTSSKLPRRESAPNSKLVLKKMTDDSYKIIKESTVGRQLYSSLNLLPLNTRVSLGKPLDFKYRDADVLKVDLACATTNTEKKKGIIKFFLCSNPKGGVDYRGSIWLKAAKPASPATIMFAGGAGGKFYNSQRLVETKKVEVDSKWRLYEINAKTPDDIDNLYLRVDIKPGHEYALAKPGISLVEKSASEGKTPQGNLIVNGGAERSWYQTGVTDNKLLTSPSGDFYIHYHKNPYYDCAREDGYADWSLEEKTKHSGRFAFKCQVRNKVPVSHDLKFNMVPVVRGRSANFSVWLKADKPGFAALRVVASPGTGYSKKVKVDQTWRKHTLEIKKWGAKTKATNANTFKTYSHGNVVSGYGVLRSDKAQPLVSISGQDTGISYWIDEASYCLDNFPVPATSSPRIFLRGAIIDNDAKCFRNGETVKANFELKNNSDISAKVAISYAIINYFGDVVFESETETVPIKAKQVLKRVFRSPTKVNGPQTLSLVVKILTNNKEYHHNCYFGVIGENSKTYRKLGMNHWTNHDPQFVIPDLKKFGVGSIRIWSKGVRPSGIYIGSDAVATCKKAGLNVLFCVNGGAHLKKKAIQGVAKDLTKWSEILKQNVIYHKGLVDCYEILNEPNIWRMKDDYPDLTQMSPKEYVRVLENAVPIIRKHAPKAKVGGPVVAHTSTNFISSVLKNGGDKYLDVITEHPYRRLPEAPDYVKDLKTIEALCQQYYKRKIPIYSTESGSVTRAMPIDNLVDKHIQNSVGFDIRRQIIGYANGVEIFYHFNVLNRAYGGNSWTLFFSGNPANNLRLIPHPHLYATYYLGEFLGDAEAVGDVVIDYSMRCYVFKKGKKSVAALWKWYKTDSPAVIEEKNGDYQVFDLFGNPQSFPVKIVDNPVYVTAETSPEKLMAMIRNMDIGGLGFPVKAKLTITSPKNFEIKLRNHSKKTLKCDCELSDTQNIVPLDDFKLAKFTPGAERTIRFETKKTISLEPFDFNFKVLAKGFTDFLSENYSLRGEFCPRVDQTIKVDGDLADWERMGIKPLTINGTKDFVPLKKAFNAKNISADIYTCWDEGFLNVAIKVKGKKGFFPPENAKWIWKNDSVQIGFDTIKNAKIDVKSGYQDDDYEYHFGLLNGTDTVYRMNAAALLYDGVARSSRAIIDDVPFALKKHGEDVVYEIAFPASSLSPFRLNAGNSIRWSVLVNLNDGKERVGWLELTPGIGQYPKNPSQFVDLILVD